MIVSAVARDGAIVVTVADDGPGVEPETRAVLFEPGVRSAGVNGHRGAGLGLALARRLAKAIGGDVTLAPQAPGAGAQFEVRLPV